MTDPARNQQALSDCVAGHPMAAAGLRELKERMEKMEVLRHAAISSFLKLEEALRAGGWLK